MRNNVRVSIITVCYNSERTIEQTVKSVLEQTYGNVEYIVVDGKSTDNTCQILQKYKEHIAWMCSEEDAGVYDAMNKGIAHCTGDIVAFLNSDDWYLPETVEKIVECFRETKPDIIYGDYIFYCSEEEVYYARCNRPIDEISYHMIFGHQAMFFRKSLFEKQGGYHTEYVIAADYEWILRAYQKKVKFQYLPTVLCYFRKGGLCTTERIACAEEVKAIAERYADTDALLGRINAFYQEQIQEAKWDCYMERVLQGETEEFSLLLQKYKLVETHSTAPPIYIFGGGKYGRQSIRWCKIFEIPVINIIDNAQEKWGKYILDIEVAGPNQLRIQPGRVLIAALEYEKQMVEQLQEMGLEKGKDVVLLSEIRQGVMRMDD